MRHLLLVAWILLVTVPACSFVWAQPNRHHPHHDMVRNLVRSGNEHREAGNWPAALKDLNQAIDLDDAYAPAFSSRGYVRGFAEPDSLKDIRGAIADYSRAFELDTLRHDYLNMRGLLHMRLREFDNAMEVFNHALRRDPGNGAYLANRGATHLLLKHTAAACADLRRAHDLGNAGATQLLDKYCK